jgi:hypothetical protein
LHCQFQSLEAQTCRSLETTGTRVPVSPDDKNFLTACYAGSAQLIEIYERIDAKICVSRLSVGICL